MIKITNHFFLDESELQFSFVRASGPGGQNVNKVATAVQLRFNVLHASSLPEQIKQRLLLLVGKKLSQEGDLIIKASRYRTQERNKHDALKRLIQLLKTAAIVPKKRKKTKPPLLSKEERLSHKKLHGKKKALRRGLDKDI